MFKVNETMDGLLVYIHSIIWLSSLTVGLLGFYVAIVFKRRLDRNRLEKKQRERAMEYIKNMHLFVDKRWNEFTEMDRHGDILSVVHFDEDKEKCVKKGCCAYSKCKLDAVINGDCCGDAFCGQHCKTFAMTHYSNKNEKTRQISFCINCFIQRIKAKKLHAEVCEGALSVQLQYYT